MQAVILAGGRGTRLRGLAGDAPKPMVPVLGKPFLEYQIAALRRAGIGDVVFCVGYRAKVISAYFGDGAPWGVRMSYVRDPEPRGTAGALKLAEPFLEERFLVLNGDTFAALDYGALAEFHIRSGALVTLAVRSHADARAAGRVVLRGDLVTAFQEKMDLSPGAAVWINGGVYVMQREALRAVPAGRPVSLEYETLPQLLAGGARVCGFVFRDYFIDIGTPEALSQFVSDLAGGRVPTLPE